MSEFDYLSVLISIILGLGITQLLSGLGRVVEQRRRDDLYGPSLVWFVVLLLAHIQTWWSFFALRAHGGWDFAEFLLVLLQPIGLYLLSVLALPSAGAAPVGLKGWYFANRRAFFLLLLGCLVGSLARDLLIAGHLPGALNLAFHLVLSAVALAAMLSARERLHAALAVLVAVLFAAYIYRLFGRLGG